MPIVSVILPYYKKINYINKTINSVLNQTFQDFEILLIYDDIELNDLLIIEKNFKNNPKIKIIVNGENLGAGISRNIGIRKAKGKYIAFLDADDLWNKDKMKNQISFMRQKKISFSFCNYKIINKNNRFIKKIIAPKNITFQKLLYSCDIGLSSVILKSDLLKNNKFPSLKTKEDYLLWLKISKKRIKMLGFNKTLVSWRKTDNSLSNSTIQKLKDAFSIYNKHLKFNFIKSIYHVVLLSLNFLRKRYL